MGKLKDFLPDCDENPEPTLTPKEEDEMVEKLLDFRSLCNAPSAGKEETEELWNWGMERYERLLKFIRWRNPQKRNRIVQDEYFIWNACQNAVDRLRR